MKKVLFISYYWPPSGGSGVQRPLKFVKYLRDFGWEPIVFTVSNGEYPELDPSLAKEIPKGIKIIYSKIFEPYTYYKKFVGQKKEDKINPNFFTQEKKGWKEKLAIWIRSNFFIPDARVAWVKPSIKKLTQYCKENQVDVIITTGPPHSAHLIGLVVKENTGIPWIADFRDPWTNIDFYSNLSLTQWADAKHRKLEKKVLQNADKVLMVGETWGKELEEIGKRSVTIISNGFDPDDFDQSIIDLDAKFSIVHLGMFSKGRNHEVLWKALSQLCNENQDFANDLELCFYGKYDISAVEYMNKYKLKNFTKFHSYIPHHEIVKVQKRAQVLFLSVNNTPNVKGIITGKIYEYLAVNRPILCIGDTTGDAAKVIQETKSGYISGFEDLETLKSNISQLYTQYKNPSLAIKSNDIEKYSRKYLTGMLAQSLDSVIKPVN